MVNGDDAIASKKNKANRKMQRKQSSNVPKRVASIIAAKKRRKSGKRRLCQGMCFSLPTPEDPFNDRHGKMDYTINEIKKIVPSQAGSRENRNSVAPSKGVSSRTHANIDNQEQKTLKVKILENVQTMSPISTDNVTQQSGAKSGKTNIQMNGKNGAAHAQEGHAYENSGCPSKFLILCLNSIQNALRNDGAFSCEEDKPLFADTWGVEFWKCYLEGKDILEASGACSTTEQIAWLVSTAADTIAKKENEGLSFTSPFLLFLVPTKEKAAKVRSVCKPLKALGIQTVSLHPGASLDHQIHGVKSCEPEFIVSTPERLLELVSLKAINISGVSLLVVDGLESFCKGGYLDIVKSIRQSIFGNPHTVVFNDCLSHASIPVVQNLLQGSICRLSLNDSIPSQCVFIIQSVHVCASDEEKLSKGIQVLDQACGSQLSSQASKVLFLVQKDSNCHKLVTAVKSKGYSISTDSILSNSKVEKSKLGPAVFVINMDQMNTADLSQFEVVVICDFVLSIDNYVEILTRMAHSTVSGMLHSFLTSKDVPLVPPLIEIFEQCGQAVPEALRHLCHSSSSMLEY